MICTILRYISDLCRRGPVPQTRVWKPWTVRGTHPLPDGLPRGRPVPPWPGPTAYFQANVPYCRFAHTRSGDNRYFLGEVVIYYYINLTPACKAVMFYYIDLASSCEAVRYSYIDLTPTAEVMTTQPLRVTTSVEVMTTQPLRVTTSGILVMNGYDIKK